MTEKSETKDTRTNCSNNYIVLFIHYFLLSAKYQFSFHGVLFLYLALSRYSH